MTSTIRRASNGEADLLTIATIVIAGCHSKPDEVTLRGSAAEAMMER
jgi:hypothetical protein